MSLSALLTAHFIPLIDWSKTTFNNVLISRGDKMYLQALNDGFVVFEFVYVGITLPKVVSVSSNQVVRTCFLNTRYVMGTRINVPAVVSVVHARKQLQHVPVDPFDAQNHIGRTLNSNNVAMVV
jgi:hypothetical protein